MKAFLLRLFIVLGPLGNIFTPAVFPNAFRTYYFILLGFPFFLNSLDKKQLKLLFLATPFFLYCFLSSILGLSEEPESLVRFFLFLSQFLFVWAAASYLKNQTEALNLYLKSFFLSLIIGYGFFIGFYLGLFSFATIERFSVLGQFGYGLLRFSIGSYPNEYGIVASFVTSVLLLMMINDEDRIFSKATTIIFLGLTVMALLLTTTRSAYIACLASFLSIAWIKKKAFLWASGIILCMIGLLKIFKINIISFILLGFNLAQTSQGSMGSRLLLWQEALEAFLSHGFFGQGFGSFSNAHNVYFQLIVELGLIGCLLLVALLMLAFFKRRGLFFYPQEKMTSAELFSKRVRRLGMMHVLWFALTNHNLNHHLTWFVILLWLSSWLSKRVEISQPSRESPVASI